MTKATKKPAKGKIIGYVVARELSEQIIPHRIFMGDQRDMANDEVRRLRAISYKALVIPIRMP